MDTGSSKGPFVGLPRVYVVVLNWNGWRDTIVCLESLLSVDYGNMCVVVCDNGSTDDSLARIRDWAAGALPVDLTSGPLGPGSATRRLVHPRFVECSRAEVDTPAVALRSDDWVLIGTGANLGFAGGCNVGLRYGLRRRDADFFWLLNNDTEVERSALAELVAVAVASPRVGITGSTLLFHDRPDRIQALCGGIFSRWKAMTQHIGEGLTVGSPGLPLAQTVSSQMDYVVGASMLVSRRFVETVGLMQEDYFLYFEELDWAERGRRAEPAFALAYAPASLVYHKVGASTGTSNRSLSSLRYLNRSRLRFVQRFFPGFLLVARGRLCWESFKAVMKGRLTEASLLLGIAFGAKSQP